MNDPIGGLYYERARDTYWIACIQHKEELRQFVAIRDLHNYGYWDIYPEQISPFVSLPCYCCDREPGQFLVFECMFLESPPEKLCQKNR
jgi:hypothetical protein